MYDTNRLIHVITNDGREIIGYFLNKDNNSITMQTKHGIIEIYHTIIKYIYYPPSSEQRMLFNETSIDFFSTHFDPEYIPDNSQSTFHFDEKTNKQGAYQITPDFFAYASKNALDFIYKTFNYGYLE